MNEQEQVETTEKLFTRIRSRKYRDWIRVGIHILIIATFFALFSAHALDRLEDFVLDGFEFQVIRNISGQTNVEKLLSQMETGRPVESEKPKADDAPAKSEEDKAINLREIPFPLPIDIQCKLHLNKMAIHIDDHMQKKQLLIKKIYSS